MLKNFDESMLEIFMLPLGSWFQGKQTVLKGNLLLHLPQTKTLEGYDVT